MKSYLQSAFSGQSNSFVASESSTELWRSVLKGSGGGGVDG